jgi:3-hexulose-6-phosphate synthase
MPILIQIALDFPTTDQAIACARLGIQAGVDILEAGTPLIINQGASSIGALKKAFPNHPVLADYKTMDSGGKNNHLTHAQGAQYMTVCANAPDQTIQAAVAARHQTGVKVVVDLIGVKNVPARAKQCQDWNVDMLYLHYGADQHRADPTKDSTQWLDEVLRTVTLPIGVGTFAVEDAVIAASKGAALVAIGHPLISNENPLASLADYVKKVRAAYSPSPFGRGQG